MRRNAGLGVLDANGISFLPLKSCMLCCVVSDAVLRGNAWHLIHVYVCTHREPRGITARE